MKGYHRERICEHACPVYGQGVGGPGPWMMESCTEHPEFGVYLSQKGPCVVDSLTQRYFGSHRCAGSLRSFDAARTALGSNSRITCSVSIRKHLSLMNRLNGFRLIKGCHSVVPFFGVRKKTRGSPRTVLSPPPDAQTALFLHVFCEFGHVFCEFGCAREL